MYTIYTFICISEILNLEYTFHLVHIAINHHLIHVSSFIYTRIHIGVDTQRRRYRALLKKQQIDSAKDVSDLMCDEDIALSNKADNPADVTKPKNYFNTTISQEQINKLLDIGFVFEPRLSREETWTKRIQEITHYKETHGHCNVREDDVENPGLGKWVSYVRRQFRLQNAGKRKKGRRLTEERINQLLSIGFVFELKEEMARVRFREGMEMLRSFYEEEGHTDVPTFYSKNPTFGLIAEDIRKEYRKICHRAVAAGATDGSIRQNGPTSIDAPTSIVTAAAQKSEDAKSVNASKVGNNADTNMMMHKNKTTSTETNTSPTKLVDSNTSTVSRPCSLSASHITDNKTTMKEHFTTGSSIMSDEMIRVLTSMKFLAHEHLTPPQLHQEDGSQVVGAVERATKHENSPNIHPSLSQLLEKDPVISQQQQQQEQEKSRSLVPDQLHMPKYTQLPATEPTSMETGVVTDQPITTAKT